MYLCSSFSGDARGKRSLPKAGKGLSSSLRQQQSGGSCNTLLLKQGTVTPRGHSLLEGDFCIMSAEFPFLMTREVAGSAAAAVADYSKDALQKCQAEAALVVATDKTI